MRANANFTLFNAGRDSHSYLARVDAIRWTAVIHFFDKGMAQRGDKSDHFTRKKTNTPLESDHRYEADNWNDDKQDGTNQKH